MLIIDIVTSVQPMEISEDFDILVGWIQGTRTLLCALFCRNQDWVQRLLLGTGLGKQVDRDGRRLSQGFHDGRATSCGVSECLCNRSDGVWWLVLAWDWFPRRDRVRVWSDRQTGLKWEGPISQHFLSYKYRFLKGNVLVYGSHRKKSDSGSCSLYRLLDYSAILPFNTVPEIPTQQIKDRSILEYILDSIMIFIYAALPPLAQ